MIQASGMISLSDPVASLGILWSSGLSLLTSLAAAYFDGTG